jgi:antitoxin (DNA-binding transcriptional repressor) of toxin-antitoxin stability system
MLAVNVTEFRKHLPAYLKHIQNGDEIQLTNRGKIIARIVPEEDEAVAARKRLEALRGKMIVGDVISPIEDAEWTGDADNL